MIEAICVLGYIGPGGGIALLGPLFGVLAAVAGALGMIAFWPLRALWKRLRSGKRPPLSETPASQ